MSATRRILDEGFSADNLERISAQCYDDDELATFPVAVVVLAHVAGAVASDLSERAVLTEEFDGVKQLIEPPLQALLDAVSSGNSDQVATSVSALSEAFLTWRRS